jgi:hypothetical protein
MRIIPDPDVIRIRELNEKLMRMGPDSVSRIRTQKFYAWVRRKPGSGSESSDPDPSKNSSKPKMYLIPDPNVIRIR